MGAESTALTKRKSTPRKFSKYNQLKKKKWDNLKKLNVVQLLILTGKLNGKSDKDIAEQLGVHRCTIKREKQKLRSSEWMQDAMLTVLDMAPLATESLRFNLLNGDVITTIAYFKGLGIFKDRHDVSVTQVDKKTQQAKFLERIKATLGDLGIDTEKKPAHEQLTDDQS